VSASPVAIKPSSGWRRASVLRLRYPAAIIAVAAAYYGAARLGYQFEFAGPVAAIVWLPAGVGIACLYLGGIRLWPGVLAGDILANDYSTLPLGSAVGQTCGNILETVVAALVLRRLLRSRSPLGSVGSLACMLAAIVFAASVSATVGSLSLLLGDVITTHAFPTVWRTWLLGDACGALIVVPLAVAWYRAPFRGWDRRRALEAVLLLLVVVIGLGELALRSSSPLVYLAFPGLAWAALRFGQRGATLAIATTSGLAVWNTVHYVGPFAVDSITRTVLSTQLFIAVSSLSTLCLAAVVSERESYARGLVESRARMVQLAEHERRRLERNLHDGAQQRLTALAVRLRLAEDRVREAPTEASRLFEEAATELARAIDELRELAQGIHPTVLTNHGLAGAMRSAARRSPVPITLVDVPAERLDGAAEATGYYVFTEAIANAQKHAHASSICVHAAVENGTLHIEVIDDGIGGANEDDGYGLRGLRDRVETMSGVFQVEDEPDGGTRLSAMIPALPAGSGR
jgi:signal transduction histidine kinase